MIMQEGKLHSDNPTPEVIPLQRGAQNSGEFWGKIPGFPGFFAHAEKARKKCLRETLEGNHGRARECWKSF